MSGGQPSELFGGPPAPPRPPGMGNGGGNGTDRIAQLVQERDNLLDDLEMARRQGQEQAEIAERATARAEEEAKTAAEQKKQLEAELEKVGTESASAKTRLEKELAEAKKAAAEKNKELVLVKVQASIKRAMPYAMMALALILGFIIGYNYERFNRPQQVANEPIQIEKPKDDTPVADPPKPADHPTKVEQFDPYVKKEPFVASPKDHDDNKMSGPKPGTGIGSASCQRADEVGQVATTWLTEHDGKIEVLQSDMSTAKADIVELKARPVFVQQPQVPPPQAPSSPKMFVDPKGRTWTAESIEAAIGVQEGKIARYDRMLAENPNNGFAAEQRTAEQARLDSWRRIKQSLRN